MSVVLDYRRKLYSIRDLPTLPAIAQRVLALADDDDAGPEKLSALISSDQSLSVKVLSLANSAYYGRRATIGTIRQAVAVIGMNMLKQLSLSVLVSGALSRGGRNRTEFWKHSFGTATACSMLAKKTRLADPDECFMAGLLHDVGVLIIDAFFPGDKEMEHTEVGAWMAERWQLPERLVNAIAFHHSTAPEHLLQPVVVLVHAANVCANLAFSEKAEELAPEVLKALKWTSGQFLEAVAELRGRKAQIDEYVR